MHMSDIARQEAAALPAHARPPAATSAWLPLAAALVLALAIVAISPLGYIGGGSDDWQYLEAARCIVREGLCVPQSHWAARLPIVLPTAAVLATLGESRDALILVPLAHGLAAIALFVALLQRAAGPRAAAFGGLVFAATPVVGGELAVLNVGIVEAFYALAAAFAFQCALRSSSRRAAALAGALLGLAILSRATALALVPIAGLGALLLRREYRGLVAPVLAGLAAVLAVDAGLWTALAGDPGHGWALSLGHTRLQSSENTVTAANPLFNADVIAGWRRSMDIHVHWMIDGALNLLADPLIAPILWAALVLLFVSRGAGRLRAPLLLLAAAALYFGALAYALGVDPKPRMFVPVVACAAAMFGLLGARVWHDGGRPLVVLLLGIIALGGAAAAYNKLNLRALERTAGLWAAGADDMAVDGTAERALTLSPAVRRLPALPAPGATRLLTVSTGVCVPDQTWRLVRSARFAKIDPGPLAALRARGLLLGSVAPLALCEFSRR